MLDGVLIVNTAGLLTLVGGVWVIFLNALLIIMLLCIICAQVVPIT